MIPKVRITRRGLGAVILATGVGLLMTAVLPREVSSDLFAARDPGVRTGPAGAGGMYTYGLTDIEQQMFGLGQDQFKEVQSVQGTIPDTELGLGPRFNMDSCAGCHAQPDVGGTRPAVNPHGYGGHEALSPNVSPVFILPHVPDRESR